MSQAAMGRKGRKNCRVIGRRREVSRRVAIGSLTAGPGVWMMHNEKMPKSASMRYWPS